MEKAVKYIRKNAKTTIWRFYAFKFLVSFMFTSGVLIPFFTDWGGISLAQVTILQSWYMFWVFLLEIPTGAVADYLGRKHSMTLGAFFLAIAALVYASIPSFEIFLIAELLFALAISFLSGANEAFLYDTLKEAKREKEAKKFFGRAHSINLSAMLISAPIGGLMAAHIELNYPMLLSAIPFLLAAIIAWTLPEPKSHQEVSESKRYLLIARQGLTYFYKHRTLRLLVIDAVVVSSAAYFVIWLYQPILKSIGVGVIYFGFIHAFLVASEILVSSNFVFLEKIAGSAKSLLRFGAIATSVTFILVAAFPSLVTVFALLIFAGGFGLTRMELMKAYMNKFIPSEKRATVLSSVAMFRSLSLIFLNPLIGFTADHSLRLAALVIGLLPLAVFFFSPIEQEMFED